MYSYIRIFFFFFNLSYMHTYKKGPDRGKIKWKEREKEIRIIGGVFFKIFNAGHARVWVWVWVYAITKKVWP